MFAASFRCTFIAFFFAGCIHAEEPAALADRAKQILSKHCYRCHGDQGSDEGGFNTVLRADRLIALKYVVPGEPTKSTLLRRIEKGEMPPEDVKVRLSADEKETLEKWIAAGAPDWSKAIERKFISLFDEAERVRADRKELKDGEGLKRRYGYVTLTPLYNALYSEAELQTVRIALAKMLNSISWAPKIVVPTPVNAEKTLYRIDLEAFGWSAHHWGFLSETLYDIAIPLKGSSQQEVQPVRADALIAKLSVPPFYHIALDLPEKLKDLESRLEVDAAENIQNSSVLRAGFTQSGVSRNNRIIERHEGKYGYYWKSYDFASSAGRKNIFAHPTGPGLSAASDTFTPDGGEMIFRLPNGMQGYMLSNARGDRLDRAPTEIVSDPKHPERVVENGLSCFSCHSNGFIDRADQIRPDLIARKNAFKEEKREEILGLYASRERFSKKLEADIADYRAAILALGGKPGGTEPINAAAKRFNGELDLRQAAAELWVTPAQLNRLLDSPPGSRFSAIRPLITPGATVKRDAFKSVTRTVLPLLTKEYHFERPSTIPHIIRPKSTASAKPIDAEQCRLSVFGAMPDADSRTRFHPPEIDQNFEYFAAVVAEKRTERVQIMDLKTGKLIHRFRPGMEKVSSLAISGDGKIVAAASRPEGIVWFMDAETGKDIANTKPLPTSSKGSRTFEDLKFTGKAGEFAVIPTSSKGTIEYITLPKVRDAKRGTKFDTRARMLAFSSDGKHEIRSFSQMIERIDRSAGTSIQKNCRTDDVTVIQCSPDDKWIAVGTKRNHIALVDFETLDSIGLERVEVENSEKSNWNFVHDIAFTRDSKYLIAIQSDFAITIWTSESLKLLGSVRVSDQNHARTLAVSPDNRKLGIGFDNSEVQVWDLEKLIELVKSQKEN